MRKRATPSISYEKSTSCSLRELLELVLVVEQLLERVLGVLRRQRLGPSALERQLAVDAGQRRRADLQVQIRALLLDELAQRLLDVDHGAICTRGGLSPCREPWWRPGAARPLAQLRAIAAPAFTAHGSGSRDGVRPFTAARRRYAGRAAAPAGVRQATSRSFCASARLWSFFNDWFSIWRIRSRVTLNVRPTSSSVRGCSPPSP